MIMDFFFTSAELAEKLGVQKRTVDMKCRSGEIPARKLCGAWVISCDFLDELVKPVNVERMISRRGKDN